MWTVNVTRESTGVITSRLLAEKDNPVADVVWGLIRDEPSRAEARKDMLEALCAGRC